MTVKPHTFSLDKNNNFCNFLDSFLVVLRDISSRDEIIALIANIFLKLPRSCPSGRSP